MRVWSEGQGGTPVPDWEDRKVEEMLAACLAKYQANPQMQEELLKETGDLEIQGAPSTWRWQFWNGRIQMKIRRERLVCKRWGGNGESTQDLEKKCIINLRSFPKCIVKLEL